MRYFHELNINNLRDCKKGKFIATLSTGKKVLIDKIGRVVSDEYKEIIPRLDGYYDAYNDYRNKGVLAEDGRIIYFGDAEIGFFTKPDKIAVISDKQGQMSWINEQSEIITPPFKSIGGFNHGWGVVELDNGKWTYVDKNMNLADVTYDEATAFNEKGHAIVKQSGEYYVIDTEFYLVGGPFENYIAWLEEDYNLAVTMFKSEQTKRSKYQICDMSGQKISNIYNHCNGYENGFCVVCDDKGYTYINPRGKELTDERFALATPFRKDRNSAQVSYYDNKGELMFKLVFSDGTFSKPYQFPNYGEKTPKRKKEGIEKLYDEVHSESCGFKVLRTEKLYDAINLYNKKLSNLSMIARQFEATPKDILSLIENLGDDRESIYYFALHGLDVLENEVQNNNVEQDKMIVYESIARNLKVIIKKYEAEAKRAILNDEKEWM